MKACVVVSLGCHNKYHRLSGWATKFASHCPRSWELEMQGPLPGLLPTLSAVPTWCGSPAVHSPALWGCGFVVPLTPHHFPEACFSSKHMGVQGFTVWIQSPAAVWHLPTSQNGTIWGPHTSLPSYILPPLPEGFYFYLYHLTVHPETRVWFCLFLSFVWMTKWNHTWVIFRVCFLLFMLNTILLRLVLVGWSHTLFIFIAVIISFKTITEIFNVLNNLRTFGLFPRFGFYGPCS